MSRKKSKKNKQEINDERPLRINEIIGIIILAFGVLMALAFYFQGNDSFSIGKFGDVLRTLFFGLFGITAYAIPPVIIIFAVISFFEKNARIIKQQLIGICCMFVIVSAMFSVAFYNPNPLENLSQLGYIQYFWKNGVAMDGGGIFGGLLSIIFLITVDVLGTIIILSAMAIIDVIIITRVSIVKTTKTFVKGTKILKDNLVDIMRSQKDESDGYENAGDSNIIDINSAKKKFNFNMDNSEKEISDEQRLKNITYQDPDDFGSGISGGKKSNKKADIVSIKNMDEDINYMFPDINLLNMNDETEKNIKIEKSVAFDTAKKLEITLKSFGVEAKVVNINRGPTVTRFELQPSPGVKVSSIVNLADDISLNLASSGVRIEAPIPGKAAVGIEVPNRIITSVPLREVIETQNFEKCSSKLAFAVGKNIAGDSIIADISNMPHLLIAGSTGSGKSVCINSMIISLLYKSSPRDVQLLMIDTKVVELASYNGIPHLLVPVVTDPKKASSALNWAVREMTNRYKLFAEKGVRDIEGYNEIMRKSAEEEEEVLPKIVIIIDELADLMIVAPSDVEDAICRLAQMARAAGMHLVIATQRPSVNVITGIIKANIPSRISFSVSSHIDSRTILDMAGAEKLLGKGDMLYHPVGEPKPIRIQGSFVTKAEIEKVVEFVKKQTENEEYNESIIEEINNDIKLSDSEEDEEYDELFDKALEIVVDAGQASASLLQRKFKIGFSRAGRIIDQMESRNLVGPSEGSKPRHVLISKLQLQEMQMREYKDSNRE